MRTFAALLVSLSLFGVVACGAPAEESTGTAKGVESEVQGGAATLTFGASGAPKLEGALVEGSTLTIRYDQSRLSKCKGRSGGRDAWTITGFASVNGEDAKTFATGEVDAKGDRQAKDAQVRLEHAGELALWFQANDRFGCNEYDSEGGKNYRFDVKPSGKEAASVAFGADGSITQKGTLQAGSKLVVSFAQERLDDCRGSRTGQSAGWRITGYASLNGGKPATFDTTRADTGTKRLDAEATIDLPESGDLALWFQNTDVYGCSAFDSDGGKNFHFHVE